MADTLFISSGQFAGCTSAEPSVRPPDFFNLYARTVLGAPDGWCWVAVESGPSDTCPDKTIRLVGAVCPLKRDGTPNWRKRDKATERTLWIPTDDLEAFKQRTADALGVCLKCWGSGMQWAGFDAEATYYRPCRRCNAPSPSPAVAASAGHEGRGK